MTDNRGKTFEKRLRADRQGEYKYLTPTRPHAPEPRKLSPKERAEARRKLRDERND